MSSTTTYHQVANQTHVPVTIQFNDVLRNKVKLLEISPDLLKLVEKGEQLQIKGQANEEAVLCTESQTFSIKRVETSNSVYLIPPSTTSSTFNVYGNSADYFELKVGRGKTEKLKETFQKLQEHNVPGNQIKQELIKLTPASKSEIELALSKIGITEINGSLQLLSKEMINEICTKLFGAIILDSWKLSEISEEKVVSVCQPYDGEVVKHVLSKIGSFHAHSATWELDQSKVARQAVHIIFSKQTVYDKDAFKIELCMQCPGLDASSNDYTFTKGILVEVEGEQKGKHHTVTTLHYLPVEDLSSEPQERLERLFAIKPAYTNTELEPYFIDLVGGPGQPKSIAEILLANTRLVDGLYRKK